METIKVFRGQYHFLSNFFPCPATFEGLTYQSSEAAFQASKALDAETRLLFTTLDAHDAKTKGKTVKLRPDWEDVKVEVMHRVLQVKFASEPLRGMLLGTGRALLEEGNWWGDSFWGVCRGVGDNYLGILLMIVRDELREEL